MFQLALLFGLAVVPGVENIKGTCHGLDDKPVPCRMQMQPYGNYYVTDEKVVYHFRRVWWGVYDMNINRKPYKAANCKLTSTNLICTNTFSFISDP